MTLLDRYEDPAPIRPITRADWAYTGVGLVYPTLLTAVYFLALADAPPLIQQSVYAVGKFIQFGLPCWWASRNPATRWRPFRPSLRGIVVGIGFGLVVGVAMVLLFRVALSETTLAFRMRDVIVQKLLGFRISTTYHYAALALFYCLIHSGLEEYYWRWFVHRSCRECLRSARLASLSSSLGFMAHHVLLLGAFLGWTSPWTWFCSVGVAVGGVFWAWLYDRTNRITAAWLSHMLVDVAIFAIGFTLVASSLR